MARFFIAPFHGNVIQLAGRAVHGPKIYAPQGIFFLPALYAHAGGVPQWNGGARRVPRRGARHTQGGDLKSDPSSGILGAETAQRWGKISAVSHEASNGKA